jgi:hypothetical protein
MEGKTRIVDLDLRAYFDNVQHYDHCSDSPIIMN